MILSQTVKVFLACFSLLMYQANALKYVGCFNDGKNRDLNAASKSFKDNCIEKCARFCAADGYKYMALQWGVQCFCGNSYGTLDAADPSDCNKKCPGNPKQICGGGWRNSVWNIVNYDSVVLM